MFHTSCCTILNHHDHSCLCYHDDNNHFNQNNDIDADFHDNHINHADHDHVNHKMISIRSIMTIILIVPIISVESFRITLTMMIMTKSYESLQCHITSRFLDSLVIVWIECYWSRPLLVDISVYIYLYIYLFSLKLLCWNYQVQIFNGYSNFSINKKMGNWR